MKPLRRNGITSMRFGLCIGQNACASVVWRLLTIVVLVLSAAACTPFASTVAPTPALVLPEEMRAFPQQAPVEGERARLTAATKGELALIDGCLRLMSEDSTGNGYLIIWPADHSPSVDENGIIQVTDGTSQVVARVGETVYMGGGEGRAIFGLQGEIPPECDVGPSWVMGNVILHPEAYPHFQD